MRSGVVNVATWIRSSGFGNVVLEIANEFDHPGFNHRILQGVDGEIELIELARKTTPGLLVSTSGLGHGRYPEKLARSADFLLVHFNGTSLEAMPGRIKALEGLGKPIVCNEDQKDRRRKRRRRRVMGDRRESLGASCRRRSTSIFRSRSAGLRMTLPSTRSCKSCSGAKHAAATPPTISHRRSRKGASIGWSIPSRSAAGRNGFGEADEAPRLAPPV